VCVVCVCVCVRARACVYGASAHLAKPFQDWSHSRNLCNVCVSVNVVRVEMPARERTHSVFRLTAMGHVSVTRSTLVLGFELGLGSATGCAGKDTDMKSTKLLLCCCDTGPV
jgi:hypothetical protein